ncbi:hypothetical protein [Microbacterium sp. NPDC058345]|uniref:hypothetical protein n=1 Tax=Microbacterium sp. NPDC058345 TaxID=3346455 RepID=UPI003647B131
MSDPLDDLLTRSAPPLADRGSGQDAMLRQMAKDARDTVRPRTAPKRRVALLSGVMAALVLGGAGAAMAAGVTFPWTQEQRDPYVAVEFTLPSGLACEQRISIAKESDYQDSGMGGWIRTFAAENDLLALADVDGYLAMVEGTPTQGEHETELSKDVKYWHAVSGSLSRVVIEEARKAGFKVGELGAQTYCTDAAGNVVVPQ